MNWPLPSKVRLFEVGPRDGLQNEKQPLSFDVKFRYIESILASGLRDVEVGAFVREDKVPQMASTDKIFQELDKKGLLNRRSQTIWGLVPNERGLSRAIDSGCKAVAVFTGATNTFVQKNIGMTIKESLKEFEKVVVKAQNEKMRIRAYISVCWGCPYEGEVRASAVVKLARRLLDMGVEQVSLGDTIGIANPKNVVGLLLRMRSEIARDAIAVHFHDTRGTALPNCLAAVGFGVKTLDSSSGGLGGCPYAPGASGNVATEDLVYMLEGMGIRTGVQLNKLCDASKLAIQSLGRIPTSKYLQAWLAQSPKEIG